MLALIAVRVISPIANFNPLGAIALMAGLLFTNRILGLGITFGSLLLGDIALSFKNPTYSEYLFSSSFALVYLAFGAIFLIGYVLGNKISLSKVLGGSLLAAIAFFLISNFGSWLYLEMYPKTTEGLVAAMNAGLPFFRATLASQVIFSVGIYFIFSLASQRKIALA